MTVGASGTYAIQGTDLTLQPTVGRWLTRDMVGMDGNAHPVYSTPRSFELNWQLISPADFQQIVAFYNTVQNTGTVAVDLPQWNSATYVFYRYSGCTLNEPEMGDFFNGYYTEAKLLVVNVVT